MIEIGKNRKGMTLVELMMAIFIMSIIIMSAMSIASIYLKGRSTIKKSQDNVEEMSLALNMLAKELRMSNCDTNESGRCSFNDNVFDQDGRQSITVVDNNDIDGPVHTYKFDAAGLKKDNSILVSGVTGKFYVYPNISEGQTPGSIPNDDPYFSKRVPRVTIMMRKDDDGSGQPMVLQTTVSMRGGYQDVN